MRTIYYNSNIIVGVTLFIFFLLCVFITLYDAAFGILALSIWTIVTLVIAGENEWFSKIPAALGIRFRESHFKESDMTPYCGTCGERHLRNQCPQEWGDKA